MRRRNLKNIKPNNMISLTEMSQKRTMQKQREFYQKTHDDISASEEEIADARIRKGIYKKFFEEFCVLLKYCEEKYKTNPKIEFRWVDIQGEKLNYDGEIYLDNELIEKVEITCPLLGEKDFLDAKDLNEYGITKMEVGDIEIKMGEIKNEIIQAAENKNNNVHYDNTITLVILLEDYKHFFSSVPLCDETLKEIEEVLKKKTFKFKNVYILKNINNDFQLVKIK